MKLPEASTMSGTEPIVEGFDDRQVASLIREAGNASGKTHLSREKNRGHPSFFF